MLLLLPASSPPYRLSFGISIHARYGGLIIIIQTVAEAIPSEPHLTAVQFDISSNPYQNQASTMVSTRNRDKGVTYNVGDRVEVSSDASVPLLEKVINLADDSPFRCRDNGSVGRRNRHYLNSLPSLRLDRWA